MTDARVEFESDWGVHPGVLLADLLESRSIRQAELAERTGLSPKHVNQIVKQAIGISADVAILLERALDVSASFWLRADALHQEYEGRRRAKASLEGFQAWARQFHLDTLVRNGIVDTADAWPVRADKLLKLFRVATPEAFAQTWLRPSVSFRRSQAFTVDEPNTALWLCLLDRSARDMPVEPFQPRKLRVAARSVAAMTTMTVQNGFVAARAALADAGVALTFVREIPKTRVGAATWWLDGDRPVIGITERHHRVDVFWFNLLHEIGHIVRHPRRTSYLDLDADLASNEGVEREANEFAVETLFPGDSSARIARAKSNRELIVLAAQLGIGVSVVAGRYGKLTEQWPLVGRIRESITEDDVAALEELVQEAAA